MTDIELIREALELSEACQLNRIVTGGEPDVVKVGKARLKRYEKALKALSRIEVRDFNNKVEEAWEETQSRIEQPVVEGDALRAWGELNEVCQQHDKYYDNLRDLLHTIKAALSRGEWRDISSAPKDGGRVMLWSKECNAPFSGQFYDGVWRYDYEVTPFKYQPTHWMPLPTKPTEGE